MINCIVSKEKGKRQVGEGTLLWATPCLGPFRFFFKWEENKYFSPYACWFIFISDLLNPNFVKKIYFILFFLESYFLDEQSKFLDVRFYWNKKVKHRLINWHTNDWREKIFYLVFIEMQIYGPRQGSRTLPWAKCQIFLKVLFTCTYSNTNLNKNFHT